MFEDFEKELYNIIRQTEHSKGHSDTVRYHDVMKALFGGQYKSEAPKIPHGLTRVEIEQIIAQQQESQNSDGSIKDFLRKKHNVTDMNSTGFFDEGGLLYNEFSAIKKHIDRYELFYAWGNFQEKETKF